MFERISFEPEIMTGKPVIRGTRLTVEYILWLLEQQHDVYPVYDRVNQSLMLKCNRRYTSTLSVLCKAKAEVHL